MVGPRWFLGTGCLIALGLWFLTWHANAARLYIPDGPDVPSIALNESQSGAAGLPPLPVPPPKGWDQESIWNMQVVGFQDNQGRASSDDGWVENQNGRYIAYMADSPGKALNPLTGKVENNGTSLIDVTDVAHPKFLSHIPTESGGGATHLAVCGGNTLPHAERNHWYLLRHDGQTNQEVWDVTNPSAPTRLSVIISGLHGTHHDWWECDTGIAYTISEATSDGWHDSGSHQHGGFHIVFKDSNNKIATRNLYEFSSGVNWFNITKQPMVILPGTYQAGFPARIISLSDWLDCQ